MGVVYRARDARLDRDVAIKVLREAFAANTSRIRLFEQEARAAGCLNHPNIVVIHDVGVDDGAPYLVSELLEGESLRAVLQRGPLPVDKAINYTRQTAEGLGAAHAKGIVHRDLKPENLFITDDGRVKVLDFGIAKLTALGDDAVDQSNGATETDDGAGLGTASYMSPELVRGESVDGRSDIFSIGAILHEMLSGRPAFRGETRVETMASILNTHPAPIAPLEGSTLDRVVTRCLEKSRDARFHSMRDLAFTLEALGPPLSLRAPIPSARQRWSVGTLALLALLATIAVLSVRSAPPPSFESRLAGAQLRRLTDWPGTEGAPAISQDGRFVSFIADREGEFDVWLTQLDTDRFVNVTTDDIALSPPGPNLRRLGFSGDGAHIWFTQGARQLLVPITGGHARPFLGHGAAAPAWSTDGSRMVFLTNISGDPLSLAGADGADEQRLELSGSPGSMQDGMHNHNPVWSPDGEWIFFLHGPGSGTSFDLGIWRVRSAGGTPQRLAPQVSGVNSIAPVDARTLLYVARDRDGTGPWLWTLDIPSAAARRMITGLDRYTTVAASANGHRIVTTLASSSAALWRVPLEGPVAAPQHPERVLVDSNHASAPRLHGGSLFYVSTTGTGDAVWRHDEGTARELWSGVDGSVPEPPAVSPDGSRVAVSFTREGKRRLSIMSADGTGRQVVAPTVEPLGAADWSPDGRWLVVGGRSAEGDGLFKISLDGTAPIRVVSGVAVNPAWSPDGRLIVYNGPNTGGETPIVGVDPDGVRVDLPDLRARRAGHRFLPDGSGLVYSPGPDFWVLDLRTRTSSQVTNFADRSAWVNRRHFDITRDGKYIVFDVWREASDVVLIEVPR
jgi:Tol biopolymer transport system component